MIKNTSKNNIISKNVRFCTSILSKAIGLMFSKKSDKSLVFTFKKEKIVPLHMLFVFYPIDVLFLDRSKRVVEMKENFRPFSFYSPKNKAKYIIELPEGAIRKYSIRLHDRLDFQNNNL